MRYVAIDTDADVIVPIPPASQPIPDNITFVYVPRIRCHDCPGKLYTPGPEASVSNFEVHLKNRQHREKVDTRIAKLQFRQAVEATTPQDAAVPAAAPPASSLEQLPFASQPSPSQP